MFIFTPALVGSKRSKLLCVAIRVPINPQPRVESENQGRELELLNVR